MTDRSFRALAGAVAVLLFVGSVVLGAKIANGLLDNPYKLVATFAAAGQGMGDNSDVKIHGVNVGRVKHVTLVHGRARVQMSINRNEKIPIASKAIIRPKTLFGEKFIDIDPGPNEATGPFLRSGGAIKDTLGGFELEKVLSELYPILKAIKPEELATVIGTLADAGAGEGPTINRTLVNLEALARVQAAHAADTQQFLDDFAALSRELGSRGDDVVAGAQALNEALPVLNQRGDELTTALEQGARLAHDVADVLEANRPFLKKTVVEGGKTIQVLADGRRNIGPLLTGLREFFEILAEASRIPYGNGTNMAAIKLVLGSDCPLGRGQLPCAASTGPQPLSVKRGVATVPADRAVGAGALTALLARDAVAR